MGLELLTSCKIVIVLITENSLFFKAADRAALAIFLTNLFIRECHFLACLGGKMQTTVATYVGHVYSSMTPNF
jgi:hypothetical protein